MPNELQMCQMNANVPNELKCPNELNVQMNANVPNELKCVK